MLDPLPACVLNLGFVPDDFMPSFCIFMTVKGTKMLMMMLMIHHTRTSKNNHISRPDMHIHRLHEDRIQTPNQKLNQDSQRGNSGKNISLFLPSQLFLGTNRLNLHRASVRHNGVMIRAARCFCGTSCMFAIG